MSLSERNHVNYLQIQTPLGAMLACASEKGICLLEFSNNGDTDTQIIKTEQKLGLKLIQSDHPVLLRLQKELNDYFDGKLRSFTVPLDFVGTDFQKSVWHNLLNIPFGKTITYAQQAKAMKNPNGIRAIAAANGKNKIAIIVPCHRVIGSNGSLTGYAGGIDRKKNLLESEAKYAGKAVQQELDF